MESDASWKICTLVSDTNSLGFQFLTKLRKAHVREMYVFLFFIFCNYHVKMYSSEKQQMGSCKNPLSKKVITVAHLIEIFSNPNWCSKRVSFSEVPKGAFEIAKTLMKRRVIFLTFSLWMTLMLGLKINNFNASIKVK